MPDETASLPATESTAPGSPASAAASAQATQPSTAPAQQTDYTFDPADLNDPTWGPKLKAVHEWGRKGHGKVGEYEGKVRNYESQVAYAKNLISTPAIAERVVAHLKANGQPVPPALAAIAAKASGTGTEEEPDKLTLLERQVAELQSRLATEGAERDAILRLGKGNLDEGNKLYNERHPKLMAIMDRMNKADPKDILEFAMYVHDLEARTGSPAASPPPAPSDGSAATDLGRGAAAPAPASAGPMTPDKLAQLAGFANERDWQRAMLLEQDA